LTEKVKEWVEKEGAMCVAEQIEEMVRVIDSETSRCPHCAPYAVVLRER